MFGLSIPTSLSKYGVFAAIAAAVALVLLLTYCQGRHAGGEHEVNKELERTMQVQASVSAADDTAASARVKDTLTIEQQKKELSDATAKGEDPDTLRKRRGCLVMRQQGRDTSNIAACRRFESAEGT